tara:strand:- start:149 stop:316 length:168 start_codon:yes stop_codon:yes gene_type:complete
MDELMRLKSIIQDIGYLDVYLNMYLKNTNKIDNILNIKEYINNNLDVWLRNGSRM